MAVGSSLPLDFDHRMQGRPSMLSCKSRWAARWGCQPGYRSSRTQAARRSTQIGATHRITVLPGDGIGPEITKVALRALEAAGRAEQQHYEFTEALIGGAAIDATGQPLPEETLSQCKQSDAVLLAAIGG